MHSPLCVLLELAPEGQWHVSKWTLVLEGTLGALIQLPLAPDSTLNSRFLASLSERMQPVCVWGGVWGVWGKSKK